MIVSQIQLVIIAFLIFIIMCCIAFGITRLYNYMYNSVSGHSRRTFSDTRTVRKEEKPAVRGYRYPFSPYPRGWFMVAETHEISIGTVKPLKYIGLDLVIFRGEDGMANVLGAHCPHLGAHLGCGGRVMGNSIRCPFHGWSFDGNGDCVKIPYSEKIPKGASVKSYPVKEQNGLILMFYEGDVDTIEPFDVPVIEEFDGNPKWSKFSLMWRCRAHAQEVAENAVDTGHFNVVHGYDSKPIIQELTTEGRVFKVHFTALRCLLGVSDNTHLDIKYYGMGVVHAHGQGKFINLKVILTITPIDEEHCEINIFAAYEKTSNFIRNWILQCYLPYHIGNDFHADIPVWENKVYRKKPLLCKGDGPILAIRRWAKQFYEEGLDF